MSGPETLPLRTLPLPSREFSARAFRDFGEIIPLSESGDPVDLDPELGGSFKIHTVEREPEEPVLRTLMNHPDRRVAFVPLAGQAFLFAVGPKADEYRCRPFPGTNEIQVFASDGSHGVIVSPGVWYAPPFALTKGMWLDIVEDRANSKADETRSYEKILKVNFALDIPENFAATGG